MSPVNYSRQGEVAVITIDHPPVNAMSTAVRLGLLDAVIQAEAEENRPQNGVIRCEGRTFVAGGDISEFGQPPQLPHLPDVYQRIEDSPIKWLAAMHGTVLGGGFELAMACAYRIATADTRFGLPEVNLGLIPGAAGTQRAPRLLGVELATDLCTTGRIISASEVLEAGGLDAIVTHPLKDSAIDFFSTPTAAIQSLPVSQRPVNLVDGDFFIREKEAISRKAKGAIAPLQNLQAIEWAATLPFSEGQPKERALHLELRNSEQSTALRHVFFAERAVSKPDVIKEVNARTLNTIGIVGGGLMGSGIAAACLNAGLKVQMVEAKPDTGIANVDRLLQGALNRKKITQNTYEAQRAGFSCGGDYQSLKNCDITIEAVFEDLQIKQHVFKQIENVVSSDAIIATNTSYINPLNIAEGVGNSSRILGLHFFSPAHIMKLLEIVRTPHTSPEVLATAFALGKQLGKIGVLSGICDGFIGNRMLAAYRRQADYLLADGAYPEQIDRAMKDFGMPMGPYQLQDLTGLQIGFANRKRMAATRPAAERYITIADELCEAQRFGQRAGAGWYLYNDGDRTPVTDPAVTELVERYSSQHNIVRQHFDDIEVQQRLIAVLANEGQRIVQEGIASHTSDIDLVKIHGYGFPRWTGGPMHYASTQGDEQVKEVLWRVCEQSPDSWVIADRYQ